MVKILRVTIISIALMMLMLPLSVSAQDIAVVREISTALADKGGTIDIRISFTAPQGLTGGVGISENVTRGWTATDIIGNPSASANFNSNSSKVELVWTAIPSGNVSVTYKLHVPNNALDEDYQISGDLTIGNRIIKIEGDDTVVVSSQKDTQPPIIHSVNVSKADPNVYIMVNVTDDFRVMSVTANKIKLFDKTRYWDGYIPAVSGTNIPVVVVAKDAGGKIATNDSQKYSSTVQPGVTQTATSPGYQSPRGQSPAGGTPTKTTTVPPGVTPSDTEPDVTDTSEPTPEVTISPTPARATPGFGLAFAIVGLAAIAYRIRRGS